MISENSFITSSMSILILSRCTLMGVNPINRSWSVLFFKKVLRHFYVKNDRSGVDVDTDKVLYNNIINILKHIMFNE